MKRDNSVNTFTPETILELQKPLDKSVVATRKQSGREVSYIEGWHAIAEANRVFGYGEWHRETVYCKEVSRVQIKVGEQKRDGWKVGYEAKVKITVGDVVREGTGHGCGSMTDLFDCIESACKEAETDAMKRAFMTFGNPFGLALYDKKQRNVEDGAAKEELERKRLEAEKMTERKKLEDSLYITIPLTENGRDGNWIDYTDLLMTTIKSIKSKAAFIAFRNANADNMAHLERNDPALRKQVSEYAIKKMKEEGWNKKANTPPAHTGTEGENAVHH